ncbi:MAG TPA: helix-turn-helix transcriptional regulator [Ignavibacteria bacterium]|nr:helix-turn-helix transcriptional regulator [Ignavibacteria bacterium]
MLNKFAEDLKKQREANGVSLQEVALKTKLNIGTFDKMENGDFSFEISAYVRAYLKQYAICIELNPDEVLKDFDLAKAGKYKPKVFESKETDKKETVKEEIIITETEKELSKVEPDKSEKNIDDKQTEDLKTEKNEVKEIPEKIIQKETELSSETRRRPKTKREYTVSVNENASLKHKSPFISQSALKTTGVIVLILLGITGLYFLINSVFLDNGNTNPVIERQNFDDVVAENEKTILGKRTQEEIEDSIRKALEEQRLKDLAGGLELKIIPSASGSVIISSDSNRSEMQREIEFSKGDTGVYTAQKFFLITTKNAKLLNVYLNNKKLEFERNVYTNLMITADGIVQKKPTQTGNQNTETNTAPRNTRETRRNNTERNTREETVTTPDNNTPTDNNGNNTEE